MSKHVIEDPFRDGLFTSHLQRWRAVLSGALLVLITVSTALRYMHSQEGKERLTFEEEQRIVVADADYPGAAALDPGAFFNADPPLITAGIAFEILFAPIVIYLLWNRVYY